MTVGVAGGPWSITVGMVAFTVRGEHSGIHKHPVVRGSEWIEVGISIQPLLLLQATAHCDMTIGGLWTEVVQLLVEMGTEATGAGEQL